VESANPERVLAKIVVTAILAVGSVAIYAATRQQHVHYMRVDELVGSGDVVGDVGRWEGVEVRVRGYVKPGSIVRDSARQTFVLQSQGKQIRVFARGPLPDMFRDQSEAVVTGYVVPAVDETEMGSVDAALEHPWVLDSSNLIVKCQSGKYEGPNKNLDTKFQ
jgi:cytochrome c-type biogenesis protein CcmE